MRTKITQLLKSESFRQLVIYCLIGGLGLVVDFGIFWLLKQTSLNVELANFISSSCGLINNFFWNSFLNFKVHDHLFRRFIEYYLVGQITTLFTTACLYIFTTVLGFDSFVVKVISTFIATMIQFIINKLIIPGSAVNGWTSLICVILLIGGLQLLCIGALGKYIGRIYEQVKHRPIYIIREKA